MTSGSHDSSNRHLGTQHFLDLLRTPDDVAARINNGTASATDHVLRSVNYTAQEVAGHLGDGPELSTGLRHLLDAQACFVRQAQIDARGQ